LHAQALLQSTTEHCLVGVRAAGRRSEDGHFVHANCDVDVIVSEEQPLGSTRETHTHRERERERENTLIHTPLDIQLHAYKHYIPPAYTMDTAH
jgi:hypothetical protein